MITMTIRQPHLAGLLAMSPLERQMLLGTYLLARIDPGKETGPDERQDLFRSGIQATFVMLAVIPQPNTRQIFKEGEINSDMKTGLM